MAFEQRGEKRAQSRAERGIGVRMLRLNVYPVLDEKLKDDDANKKAKDALKKQILNEMDVFQGVLRKLISVYAIANIYKAEMKVKDPKEPKKEDGADAVKEGSAVPEKAVEQLTPEEKRARRVAQWTSKIADVTRARKAMLSDLEHQSCEYLHARKFFDEFERETGKEWLASVASLTVQVLDDWCKHPSQTLNCKASNSWALINGKQRLPLFRHTPLSFKASEYTLDTFRVRMTWIKNRPVTFKIKYKRNKDNSTKLDPMTYGLLQGMVSGRIKYGTMTLHRDDRDEFFIRISYEYQKDAGKELDDSRCMEVAFQPDEPDKYFLLTIREGKRYPKKGVPVDEVQKRELSILAALNIVDRIKAQADKWKEIKSATGNAAALNRGEGCAKANAAVQRHVFGLTKQRRNFSRTWNHTWTKRIVETAKYWRCKRIKVFDLPPGKPENEKGEIIPGAGLTGRPWEWSAFAVILKSKCDAAGITVEFVDGAKAGDIFAAAAEKGGETETV
jgi:hypothetical protein